MHARARQPRYYHRSSIMLMPLTLTLLVASCPP
eukprot:COSAG01_NODE_60125_length_296_cov_0.959391_1_plen_32_part_01